MSTLTEEDIHFAKQYSDMLESIEEGFQYVLASFQDYSKTKGDLVLRDIFYAFLQIVQVNQNFSVFHDEPVMLQAVNGFEDVVSAAEKMDGLFEKSQEKQEVVQRYLYPAFQKWSKIIVPLLGEKNQ